MPSRRASISAPLPEGCHPNGRQSGPYRTVRRVTARPDFNREQLVAGIVPETVAWRRHVLPFLLVVGALLLYLPRLEVPGRYIYDEAYHAFTAGEYLAGNPDAFLWST